MTALRAVESEGEHPGPSYTAVVDLNWLESFLALLEHGSFTRAAEAQHLSQPAFSRRIRSLERWLGAELVDRSTFPVVVTLAGARLRAEAAATVSGLAAVRDQVRGRELAPRDAVTVALSHTLATAFFTGWWQALAADGAVLPCRLLASNTLEAYEALHHGGCDLLLAYVDPAHPLGLDVDEVESVTVARDRLAPCSAVVAGGAAYPIPAPPGRRIPFLGHGSGAFLGRVTDRARTFGELSLQPVVQCDLTETLASLVIAGAGVAWLPGLLTHAAVGDGLIVEVGAGRWDVELEVRLYRRRAGRVSEHARTIWERAARLAEDDAARV